MRENLPCMSNPSVPELPASPEANESFDDILSQYEQSHARQPKEGRRQIEGTVVAVRGDAVYLDIGYKTEGVLPVSELHGDTVTAGDTLPVSVTGRGPEGYYQLSRSRVELPKDWAALERAFAERTPIMGTVSGVVKGGLSVDVGVRAFLPASRSGARDAAEMEKMVGQEIRCRIIKLDVAGEDVVVDRRIVDEEEERATRQRRYAELQEGETVSGTVRSLTDYGAFVDVGGVDALLHVGDISWARVNKPADVLAVGQQIEARVLRVDAEKRRVALGLKQLQPHPWDSVAEKYHAGERVRGVVTRVADFGAFVELEPGIEGLIHVSEMSWAKKITKASALVKPGETVEVVILGVNSGERRMSLGLKQALGDPWADADKKFPVGSAVQGPVVSLTKFGAFVQLAEGVDGMVHVSEISAEKRIDHPQDVLKAGQMVRVQVLAIDKEKRQMRLSMKQLAPTTLDEYVAEHKPGDVVSGRTVEVAEGQATVELGEGIRATCRIPEGRAEQETKAEGADLSSLSAMLKARWKGAAAAGAAKAEPVRAGQIRSFKISRLDAAAKKIELELA